MCSEGSSGLDFCKRKILKLHKTNIICEAVLGLEAIRFEEKPPCVEMDLDMYNINYSATGFESKMACFCVFWLVFCELQVVAG